ncbi:hypothetical protein CC1G_02653 [Coprinopsis cinerea okayama7|uniref:Uncharacterized protein n=1 Tax=Coprinopsis cinerea (strain Okayama-7 / 130 / ATCC MYA-4618 / FGSC 9003) TaxID=240176 RepID=A8PBI3_COPC7|nr:hypothetical protein CC1G_02653 [Coprinopsis cinerea okayama7\|eukprot:XP_001840190.2 hypothetical protein CC1G_02653 [Coprinopsis cinerea okayama7\
MLLTVVEIIKREVLKRLAEKRSARLKDPAPRLYRCCLEQTCMWLAQMPYTRVTLSLYKLPSLVKNVSALSHCEKLLLPVDRGTTCAKRGSPTGPSRTHDSDLDTSSRLQNGTSTPDHPQESNRQFDDTHIIDQLDSLAESSVIANKEAEDPGVLHRLKMPCSSSTQEAEQKLWEGRRNAECEWTTERRGRGSNGQWVGGADLVKGSTAVGHRA